MNSASRSRKVEDRAAEMLGWIPFSAGQKYLDFGCGNGAAALRLARDFQLNVTGIDVDPDQISSADTLRNGHRNVRFLAVDGTRLPFGDAEFDIVSTHMVTHHIPNWPHAIWQMIRLLKPGGHLLYTDLVFPTWVARVGSRLTSAMGFPTVEGIEEALAGHGLRPVRRQRSFFRYRAAWIKPLE